MARRYGGKFSPEAAQEDETRPRGAYDGARIDPVGARANALFLPAIPLALSVVPMVTYTVQRTGLKKEEAKATQAQAQAQMMMAAAQMPPMAAAPFMAAMPKKE